MAFQHIPDSHFHPDRDFLVKESRGMKILFGILCIFAGLVLAGSFHGIFLLLMLIPAFMFFMNSGNNSEIMKVNKLGFYYKGRLITNWENFISAKFEDEVPIPGYNSTGINDRYFLMLRYCKEGEKGHFGLRIRLATNQNKSEEEVMAAIRFYYKQYQGREQLTVDE